MEGVPQERVISLPLANHFLHYALDLWMGQCRKRKVRGDFIVVRYADDFVLGIQHRQEAERFLADFKERLEKF